MKKTIKISVGANESFISPKLTIERTRALAIVVSGNKIVLNKFHTEDTCEFALPGGAIEHGESPRDAVFREVREETGVLLHSASEFLEIHEYWNSFDSRLGIQKTHCFLAQARKHRVSPQLTESEKQQKITPCEVKLQTALSISENLKVMSMNDLVFQTTLAVFCRM